MIVALVPLAVYLAFLGYLNLRRRPLVVGGGRDLAALGIGVAGLVLIGPIELLLPRRAVTALGPQAWLLAVVLYSLGLTLLALLSRPKLVIYNIDLPTSKKGLDDVIPALDPDARWAGASLAMPNRGVELHLEASSIFRNVTLIATHEDQSFGGWRELDAALSERFERERSPLGWTAFAFVAGAILIAALLSREMFTRSPAIAEGCREMLRL